MQISQTPPALGSAPNPGTTMVYAPKKKSGCGCCGCLSGCLVLLLLSLGVLAGALFFLDLGKLADQTLLFTYKTAARPLIIESFNPQTSDLERKQALEVMDGYVDAYMNLPAEDKKPIRQEALIFLYHEIQNQKVPNDKVVHLNIFIENTQKNLMNQHHDWNPTPTLPQTISPKILEPTVPPPPPPEQKPIPRLKF